MALQDSTENISDLLGRLDAVRKLIAEDEATHSGLHINVKLFGRKLAVQGYRRVLDDAELSPAEKLGAIYQIAANLCLNPKFNAGTDVHQRVKEIASEVVVSLEKGRRGP